MISNKLIILILILLIFILAYSFYCIDNVNMKKESFKANSNITSMELMNFDYLKQPNYKNSILLKYYLNNDARAKNRSVIPRPLAYPYTFNGINYYYGTGLGNNNGLNQNFLNNINPMP